jgi:tetratricopeptide (TPR) repeat protein
MWIAWISGALVLIIAVLRWRSAGYRKAMSLVQQVGAALAAGELKTAETLARQAIDLAPQARGGQSTIRGLAHFNLATAYLHQQRWPEAEAAGRIALETFEKEPRLAAMAFSVVGPLAQALIQQRKFDPAERLVQRYLDASATTAAPIERAVLFGLLAMIVDERGESRRATELFDLGIRMINDTMAHPDAPPEVSQMLAEMLLNRANSLRRRDPNGAISGYLQAADILEQHAPSSDSLAMTLSNAAIVMEMNGRHEEAEAAHRRALALREKNLPPGDLRVGISLNNLANALVKLNKLDEAEQAAQRGSELMAVGDPVHRSCAMATRATVLAAKGCHQEALPLFEESLAMAEEVQGQVHPDLVEKLVDMLPTLDALGKTAEAAAQRRRIAKINEAFADA